MTKITNSMKSFHLRVKTLYDIEKQLEIALPKMAEASTNPALKEGFMEHLEETKEQVRRLESIFEMIGQEPEKHQGQSIRGLISDGEEKIRADASNSMRDVMLAGAGRDVEHFEMACYMNAIEEARMLGMDDAVDMLELSLEEEVLADEKLSEAFEENLSIADAEDSDDEE